MSAFDYSATYYKFIGNSRYSASFPYKIGLNRISDKIGEEFNPEPNCGPGGLYFTDVANIFDFMHFGTMLCTIRVPENAQVVEITHGRGWVDFRTKYKCDQFIVESMEELNATNIKMLIHLGANKDFLIRKWDRLSPSGNKGLLLLGKELGAYRSRDIYSLLSQAIKLGGPEEIKMLIDIFPEMMDYKHKCLALAVLCNNIDAVQILIEAGATLIDDSPHRRLDLTIGRCSTEVLQYVVDNNVMTHELLSSSLRLAVNRGRPDVIKILVNAGANIYPCSAQLLQMAMQGPIELVRSILNKGTISPGMRNCALREAAARGDLDVVKLLVKSGADIHFSSEAALRYAARNNHPDVVQYLIDSGAIVSVHNSCALRWAYNAGNHQVVEILKAAL